MPQNITIEVAPGELIDKLTILAIKLERIADPAQRENVRLEHDVLMQAHPEPLPPLAALTAELRAVNESLWEIEDGIRDCERAGDFGDTFVALARAVYKTNDRRAAIKREINMMLGSRLVEEKSYRAY